MIGTLINVATVALGASIGLSLKNKLPERFVAIVFQALGLFTCFIGLKMAWNTPSPFLLVLALLFGSILGEALRLDDRVNTLGDALKKRVGGGDQFTEGLVAAFLLFCVGAMTILGCLDEGINQNREIIITKAIMDFFSSTALAAALGRGVLFSIIPLFLYQGGLTLAAEQLQGKLDEKTIASIMGVGGVMLLALGLQLLKIKNFKLINFLPALLIVVLLKYAAQFIPMSF